MHSLLQFEFFGCMGEGGNLEFRVQLPGPRALLSYCPVRVGQLLMFTRLLWVLEEDIEILILDGRGEQGARVLGVV